MAVETRDIRVESRDGPRPHTRYPEEPALGELFRQLSEDATHLIRQEVALGKAEIRETATAVGKDAAKLGIAAVLGLLGTLAVMTFLIVGLGQLIGSFWLSALIVAVVFLGLAAVLANRALADIRTRDLKPTRTIETLRADADWARQEVDTVKREWSS